MRLIIVPTFVAILILGLEFVSELQCTLKKIQYACSIFDLNYILPLPDYCCDCNAAFVAHLTLWWLNAYFLIFSWSSSPHPGKKPPRVDGGTRLVLMLSVL